MCNPVLLHHAFPALFAASKKNFKKALPFQKYLIFFYFLSLFR